MPEDPKPDKPDKKSDKSDSGKKRGSPRHTLKLTRDEKPGEITITATVKEFDFQQKSEVSKKDVEVKFFHNGANYDEIKKTGGDGCAKVVFHHLPPGLHEVSAKTMNGPFAQDSTKFTVKGEEYRLKWIQRGRKESGYLLEVQAFLGTMPVRIKVLSFKAFDDPDVGWIDVPNNEKGKTKQSIHDRLFYEVPEFTGKRKELLATALLDNGKTVSENIILTQPE